MCLDEWAIVGDESFAGMALLGINLSADTAVGRLLNALKALKKRCNPA